MASATYTKDPATHGVYVLEWAPYLAPGATIANSAWEVPDDLTLESDEVPAATTTTKAVISGGVSGSDYLVYNTITDNAGLVVRRSIVLRVIDAALISEPTDLEQQLSALRVALGQKAAKDVAEYQIANRMQRAYSFEDLLAWEKRLSQLVSAERRTQGGPGFFKNHFVRPTEPGP
jgi:hypothetical protein